MADSIRKLIVAATMARVAGDSTTPMPPELGAVKLTKNRKPAIARTDIPMYAFYFQHEQPTPAGDIRKPMLMTRMLTMATRIITNGNDDDADPHCQWVTARMASSYRLPQPDGTTLALSVREGETLFELMEGSEEERTVTTINWIVEYTTLPVDITKTK